MAIIHTVLSPSEVARLSQRDNSYLRRQLNDRTMLNTLLNRPINRPLLTELRCILDRQPIPRQKTEQYRRNGKVYVYVDGWLVRIEHSNGKVIRYLAYKMEE